MTGLYGMTILVLLVSGKKLITHLYYHGVGTGQTVALWEGASSVTDSETLGNAPITVSGNNSTFAGTISSGAITSTANISGVNLIASTAVYSGGIFYGSSTLSLKKSNGNSYVDFDTNLNATFAGGTMLSSGAINSATDWKLIRARTIFSYL